jgi:hypothetical protein
MASKTSAFISTFLLFLADDCEALYNSYKIIATIGFNSVRLNTPF